MTASHANHSEEQLERLYLYALDALPATETPEVQAHVASCSECQRELSELRPVLDALVCWPTDVVRPARSLWGRLASRVGLEADEEQRPDAQRWAEPEWEQVAPGISCKLLANDADRHLVSMLVRLAPGTDYPPHSHAAIEELHLLEGELMIDDRKLYPGDYNRAEPGTADKRVWSETGCTCVLITSTQDELS